MVLGNVASHQAFAAKSKRTAAAPSPAARIRDPERRERILAAAATLVSERGYLGVSLGDIGSAAGIVGSGIYRHFDTKVAILVAMFDRVVDRLVTEAEELLRDDGPPEVALTALVRGQVEFTMKERALCEVYLQEQRNLPPADLRRLRWKMRHYIDLWQDLLRSIQPALTPAQAQVLVHGAISSVHSVLLYRSSLPDADLANSLQMVACRVLGITTKK